MVGTIAAVLYVFLPAFRAIPTLSPADRISYIQAFVKTPRVSRLALLLFWVCSIRFVLYAASAAQLAAPEGEVTGVLGVVFRCFVLGAHDWAPLAFLAIPVLIYFAACAVAILLRARLKSTKQDPDLIQQRQRWCAFTHTIFASAFIASILSVTLSPQGPSYMLSNWLLASAKDANIFSDEPIPAMSTAATPAPNSEILPQTTKSIPVVEYDSNADALLLVHPLMQAENPLTPPLPRVIPNPPVDEFIGFFDTLILSVSSGVMLLVLLEPALRLNSQLTSFCWRVVSWSSLHNVIEAFIGALRLPARSLQMREANSGWTHAGRTLIWVLTCYFGIFWIFGFCGGPLGYAIQNWMMSSAVEAGFTKLDKIPGWVLEPNFRIFIASIVALYGTAPVAVSTAVILPYKTRRKIFLNSDGLLFSQGPYLALWGRPFRLWSDLKTMSVNFKQTSKRINAEFALTFASGGKVTFTNAQVSVQDLKVLLDCIDQHAVQCAIDPSMFATVRLLEEEHEDAAPSDGIADSAISSIPAVQFSSTVFMPLSTGECIPGRQIRIVKQLSSKPLCAVYLGRDESGRMVTIKQFYIHDNTDETRALAKLLQREYDLLTRLEHPAIAKVLESFSAGQSTYLIIEHRIGADLRENVLEHGPRSEALVIDWALQLAKIMLYLHGCESAIIHRDLTPDNIVIGDDGLLRLIDFGAAREFLDGITGTIIGKHCYIAPEQLRGMANQRSDVYSFGATVYFLLTGRDPVSLWQSYPSKTMDCSEELDQLVRDCTEFDEDKRPQSFDEVLRRLTAISKGTRLKLPMAKEKALA